MYSQEDLACTVRNADNFYSISIIMNILLILNIPPIEEANVEADLQKTQLIIFWVLLVRVFKIINNNKPE